MGSKQDWSLHLGERDTAREWVLENTNKMNVWEEMEAVKWGRMHTARQRPEQGYVIISGSRDVAAERGNHNSMESG